MESQNQSRRDDRDVRCPCGQLIASWAQYEVEIKCKRCRGVSPSRGWGCTASHALIESLVKPDTPFSQQRRLTHESQSRIQASSLYPCVGFYGGLAFLLDLFSEVVLQADLFDRLHLRFDPIDMLIHVFGHILKHMTRGEIVHLRTMHDTIVE